MTTNHIDQLTEWWENAEEVDSGTVAGEGDHIITRKHPSPHYPDAVSYVAHLLGKGEEYAITAPYTRILARAPKPAWHDAVAVLANHRDYADEPRTVWARELDPDGHDWSDAHTTMAAPHHLVNVTPLIEAKVTDEMVDAAYGYAPSLFPGKPTVRRLLAAALGLDPA